MITHSCMQMHKHVHKQLHNNIEQVPHLKYSFIPHFFASTPPPLGFLHKAVETNIKGGPFRAELRERSGEGKTARSVEHRTPGY